MKVQQHCKTALYGVVLSGALCMSVRATPTVWNGPLLSFTEVPGSNPSLPQNQDRITPDVWITRGTSQGLFNAHSESYFSHFYSPAGTEWADGTLANYSSLHYTDWNDWAKGVHGGPPTTVGVQAVMHIIPDDIYLSVDFTSWGGVGGGFSYLRSTPTVPEPSAVALLVAGLTLGAVRRPRLNSRR